MLCVAQASAAGSSTIELVGRTQGSRSERDHNTCDAVGDNTRGDIDDAEEICPGAAGTKTRGETDAEIFGSTEPSHESPQDYLLASLGYWSAARVHSTNRKKGIAALMYERAAIFREMAGEFRAAAVIYYIAIKVYGELGDKEKVAELRLKAEAVKIKEMSCK